MDASTSSLSSLNSGWVIQKFGGTSVGKFSAKICNEVVAPATIAHRVAIVCSARSSQTKSEGTTNRLLTAVELAVNSVDDEDDNVEIFTKTLDLIEMDHINNARETIGSEELQEQLIKDTIAEIHEVRRLLSACCVIGEVPPRTYDLAMACGEKLSCRFMAALLEDRGIPSHYIDLSDVVNTFENPALDDESGSLKPAFYQSLGRAIAQEVNKAPEGTVPVLTGYFGPVPGGLLHSIGRGYTDLCAALCAVGLAADELQIWKEVDGIFTADPRKVPSARLLTTVTPDEAAELTYYGSEVIHPFTMEQVVKARIPIRIKNVMNPLNQGTIIYPDNQAMRGEETPPHPPIAVQNLPSSLFRPKGPTAITAKSSICVLNVHSNKRTLSHGFLASVFKILDSHKLVVDLISTSEVHVSMAMSYTKDRRKNLMHAVSQLRTYGECDVTSGLAIVSLVGIHMKQLIGIAGQMFKTLANAKINIEMISQGANEINISCVIDEKNVIKALNALHDTLLLDVVQEPVDQRISELRLE